MYNPQDIATKIKLIAKKKEITIKQLLEDIGLGFNTMSNMKTSVPKADNLAKIADYLDCSVDYLLGRTDEPNGQVANTYSGSIAGNTFTGKSSNSLNVTNSNASTNTRTISKQALELAQIFDNLDLRKQNKILSLIFELEAQDAKS